MHKEVADYKYTYDRYNIHSIRLIHNDIKLFYSLFYLRDIKIYSV